MWNKQADPAGTCVVLLTDKPSKTVGFTVPHSLVLAGLTNSTAYQ
jgi:hypothetical protein